MPGSSEGDAPVPQREAVPQPEGGGGPGARVPASTQPRSPESRRMGGRFHSPETHRSPGSPRRVSCWPLEDVSEPRAKKPPRNPRRPPTRTTLAACAQSPSR